jgi:hypothetical protein
MRRAYLLIVVPAAIVGVFYLVVLHWIGAEVQPAPFLGAVGMFVAALLIVRYYQRRKAKRPGS